MLLCLGSSACLSVSFSPRLGSASLSWLLCLSFCLFFSETGECFSVFVPLPVFLPLCLCSSACLFASLSLLLCLSFCLSVFAPLPVFLSLFLRDWSVCADCHIDPNFCMLPLRAVNGRREVVCMAKNSAEDVCKWLEHLRTRSGVQIVKLAKNWHTDSPTIQGVWHPFLNKNPSLATATFPDPSLYRAVAEEKSATELVLEEAGVKKIGSVEEASSKE